MEQRLRGRIGGGAWEATSATPRARENWPVQITQIDSASFISDLSALMIDTNRLTLIFHHRKRGFCTEVTFRTELCSEAT
ncbi:hypothetical protein GWI33_006364 [Rhynchophorus ferrugineus]|uniref:Uncharacterized protein n=1 Tax=Rhynchophorus ferrugineus TaxID=354439 RepID=A0A834ITW0_RHYFE|nr:hypothetical protein GWI33_006364 [Rhynchophorus ferrugineus]